MSAQKKQVRGSFNTICLERDQYTCQSCKKVKATKENWKELLDVHHITDRSQMPNGGYVKENGITLCKDCHLKAERFHVSNGNEWIPTFHPDDLYQKIQSSHVKAVAASV